MKRRIVWLLSLWRGKQRLFWGFCPLCNSDAPELYDCPVCNYYSSASGDRYPPAPETKAKWWAEYKLAIDERLYIGRMVDIHRKAKGITKP